MKKLLLLLMLLLIQSLIANEVILQLDTKGHRGNIKDIIITKSGDIISASDDKTIRIWDSKTGKEKRKILGEIGLGWKGTIVAIALSPNEEFLVVGGVLAGIDNLYTACAIRVYNYKSGKLIGLLKSHTNTIKDLAFSKDGKYLISASSDFTAKIWSTKTWKLLDTIKSHTKNVQAVKIIKIQGSYFAITVGDDNQISLYDMERKEKVKSYHLDYKISSLATSEKHIAICGKANEIKIYDYNLNLIETIKSETRPEGLAYSPNEYFLISGHATPPTQENIYNVKKHYQKIQSFKKHKNLTKAVAFLDNKIAVTGGGDKSEIYIWEIKSGKILKKIEGVGNIVWSIGIKGDTLGWGNERLTNNEVKEYTGKIYKSINLKSFKIKNQTSTLKRILTQNGNYSLTHKKGGEYGYYDAILEIKKYGQEIKSIVRTGSDGFRHRCYGWYKNYIISGGLNGQLKIYNIEGQEIGDLVGHTGGIWTIAIDRDRLVSGSGDGTIRIWDLSQLKLIINEKLLEEGMRKLKITREETISYAKKHGINIYITQQIKPQLNLFISKTNEWIAWTSEGYYNASKNGANYIGFHINQGDDKEAKFVTVGSMKNKYYKPELIRKILER